MKQILFFTFTLLSFQFVFVEVSSIGDCFENEYNCPTGTCIDKLMICDGIVDCPGYYDELDCNNSSSTHIQYHDRCSGFRCGKNICLSKKLLCDGHIDCPLGEDELKCLPPDIICLSDCGLNADNVTFERCLPKTLICDGKSDCHDGLDELNCSRISDGGARSYNKRLLTEDNSTFIDCTDSNAFNCGDGKCIDKNLICNTKFDCPGGQDELDFCDKTPCETKGCSHYCHFNSTNNSSKCTCSNGYQLLADGLTCEDMDECNHDPFKRPCTQDCVNTLGSYMCSCFEGYVTAIKSTHCVQLTDNNRCSIHAKDPFLLALKDNNIFLYHFKCIIEQSPIILATVSTKITTFTYDRVSGKVYLYDVNQKSIKSVHFKNETDQFIKLENDAGNLVSLTFDDLTGNLYWIEPVKGLLNIASTKDPNKTIVTLSESFQDATSLALYQERGELYISMVGLEPKITVSNLHGKSTVEIYEFGEIFHPTALFVDKFSKRLFWSDFGFKEVYYVSLDGPKGNFGPKEMVYRADTKTGAIRSMIVFDDMMYLASDLVFTQARLHDSKNGKNLDSADKASSNGFDVHFSVDFNYKSPCLNKDRGNCSHICTFIDSTVSCLCPNGMILDKTQRNCINKIVSCLPGEILCSDGSKCYNETAKCNGYYDCDDHSDELDCKTFECPENLYKCKDASSRCLSKNWLCDGFYDCPDGSDESNCAEICPQDSYKCDNFRCIPKLWVCDQVFDCDDKSDEENCH